MRGVHSYYYSRRPRARKVYFPPGWKSYRRVRNLDNKQRPVTDENLRRVFDGAADFVIREVPTPAGTVFAYFIDGLVSGSEIAESVAQPLVRGEQVWNAVADPVSDLDTAAKKLVNGFCIVCGADGAIAYEAKTGEKRSPAPPEVENTVKGAKDAFTETSRTNTSLIRRHLRTPDLRLYETQVGRRSLTNVSVLWIKGLTSPALVEAVRTQLAEIDIDGMVSPAAVEEYLTGSRETAFPLLTYTERTDHFARGLLSGRVGVLIDGLPLGYLLPVDIGWQMESPEDRGMDYLSASCVRVLRYVALLVSLLLPGLYIAAAAYHQEMIPTQLLLSIIESKQSVPFPTILEVLGLLISFELLQEAGLHLPQAIGQAVSIIGGLVVGTAAVEARLISPAALIVVAAAGICGFTLPSKDFSDAIRLWRFVLAVCASLAGMFGLTAGALALLIHLAGLRSCGRPYLAPFSRASAGRAVLRRRLVTEKYRDRALDVLDERNQA